MRYVKKVNNNMALAADGKTEWVVFGKGLGFGFKKGDDLPDDRIEKRFQAIDSDERGHKLYTEAILSQVDSETIEVIAKTSSKIESVLGFSLTNYNFLALADHISFAIKRAKDSVNTSRKGHFVHLDRVYPTEYKAAKIMFNALNVALTDTVLPEEEIDYLTLHYVNAATSDLYLDETIEMTKLIQKITQLISYSMQINIDTSSINYSRFVTHIRFLMVRQKRGEASRMDSAMHAMVKSVIEQFPNCFSAADKVARLLEEIKGWKITDEEILYLTMHIWRLVRE